MKVRFYRGPYDGKKLEVNPALVERGVIKVHYTKRRNAAQMQAIPNATIMDLHMTNETSYSIRMMGVTIGGTNYRAPAMHPDGSLIFEWDEKRGKRV